MISIVISTRSSMLLEKIIKNIEATIGVEVEIIAIENSQGHRGISEVYNAGAQQAKYSYLCFCHEDILFHTKDWGAILTKYLAKPEISLVGILGSTIKTKTPSGVYTNIQGLNRVNQLQRFPDGRLVKYHQNPLNEAYSLVSTLDGLFFACTKKNWERRPFDEKGLKRFHGYDVDFSLSQQDNGAVIVIYDIDVEHKSFGGNTKDWIEAQVYVSQKWKSRLPHTKQFIPHKIVARAEIESQNQLLLSLYTNQHKLSLARQMTLKMLANKPFHRNNYFFLKQFIKSLR